MADTTIGTNSVTLSENWGAIQFYDYTFNNEQMDFQDLMVAVSEKRAVSVEGEVTPMTTRMRTRNAYLDQLGSALAEVTKKQAEFNSDSSGDTTMSGWFSEATTATIRKAGAGTYLKSTSGNQADATKAGIEGIIQGEWQLLQDAAAAAAAAAGEGAPAEQPAQETVVDQVPENVAAGN